MNAEGNPGSVIATFYWMRRAYIHEGALTVRVTCRYEQGHSIGYKKLVAGDAEYDFLLWLYNNYPENAPDCINDQTRLAFKQQFDQLVQFYDSQSDEEHAMLRAPVYTEESLVERLCGALILVPLWLCMVFFLAGGWIYEETRRPLFFLRKRFLRWWDKING
ncbi:MAG: hypothetical protein H8F28_05410 [Fibrella sp.]|nr:hypothetical protein [Armatimonadota bacterium]